MENDTNVCMMVANSKHLSLQIQDKTWRWGNTMESFNAPCGEELKRVLGKESALPGIRNFCKVGAGNAVLSL